MSLFKLSPATKVFERPVTVFRGMDTPGKFSTIFYKGDNSCYFLSASVHTKVPSGKGSELQEKLLSHLVVIFFRFSTQLLYVECTH